MLILCKPSAPGYVAAQICAVSHPCFLTEVIHFLLVKLVELLHPQTMAASLVQTSDFGASTAKPGERGCPNPQVTPGRLSAAPNDPHGGSAGIVFNPSIAQINASGPPLSFSHAAHSLHEAFGLQLWGKPGALGFPRLPAARVLYRVDDTAVASSVAHTLEALVRAFKAFRLQGVWIHDHCTPG